MKWVKSIELVLENCECIRFLPEQIGRFRCSNITVDVARAAVNCIEKQKTCEWMCIELLADADQKYNSLGAESEFTAFARLEKFKDIAVVNIIYEDESIDSVFVPWNDDSEEINVYQTSFVDSRHNLCILISRTDNAENFFR